MSLPVWPVGLPYQPMVQGFGVPEPHVSPYETEFEGGAYRRRPRSSVRRALFNVSWLFDGPQYQSFREFYHRALIEGTMRFVVQVPDGPTGNYVSRTCQFKGMYKEGPPQGLYRSIAAEIYVFGGV